MRAEGIAGAMKDQDMIVGETMAGDMGTMETDMMTDLGIEMIDMVDAIEMIVTEDMKIVTNLPQNTALEDITSSSTDDFCIYVW